MLLVSAPFRVWGMETVTNMYRIHTRHPSHGALRSVLCKRYSNISHSFRIFQGLGNKYEYKRS